MKNSSKEGEQIMLKIQSDRVIIDGHEPTKEQCETMTLLANALAKSESFKTVKYESGYAEFERVGKTEELKFVAAPAPITVIFDSHITKVVYHGPKDIEFTVSGETKTGNAYDGAEYLFTVTLETGYVLDTVTLNSTNPDYGTLVDKTDTTFTILASVGGIYQTITLTSKQATPKVSVDLTTLPGWSSLSSGSHSITIVAKAENYRDSEPSAAVSVTKGAALISFTIGSTSYQAEEGMTWAQWCESSYNTDGYYTMEASITVWFSNGVDQVSAESFSGGQADKTSQIVANGIYYKFNGGSIGN